MVYDPQKHHRRSIRLQGFDYSTPGAYFVTICIQHRKCLLGSVVNKQMRLNDAGEMVERWWTKLPDKYPTMELDEFIFMPNHMHGIVFITDDPAADPPVGAGPRACPDPSTRIDQSINKTNSFDPSRPSHGDGGAHMGASLQRGNAERVALDDIMEWYKTMSTNEYIRGVKQLQWPPFDKKFWQRGYHEHIIRSEAELDRIRKYLIENPLRWDEDENHPNR